MFQRDYVLRMIEMMGDLARRIAELMDELDHLKLLDSQCREHCGLSFKALESLSAESLLDMLGTRPRLLASELCYLRAMLPSVQWGVKDGLLLKSLRLLASLHTEGPLCEARLERMRELKAALLPQLAAADLMACARFFSQAESYGDMEDALFQACELARSHHAPDAYVQQGVAMLNAAAHADERTLLLCGTTPAELDEAALELNAMRLKS